MRDLRCWVSRPGPSTSPAPEPQARTATDCSKGFSAVKDIPALVAAPSYYAVPPSLHALPRKRASRTKLLLFVTFHT